MTAPADPSPASTPPSAPAASAPAASVPADPGVDRLGAPLAPRRFGWLFPRPWWLGLGLAAGEASAICLIGLCIAGFSLPVAESKAGMAAVKLTHSGTAAGLALAILAITLTGRKRPWATIVIGGPAMLAVYFLPQYWPR